MRFADRISRGATAVLALSFIMMLTMARPAQAQTESVLYNFCSLTNCDDGLLPMSNVIMDAQGNMYGTTIWGGLHASGTVFKLDSGGTLTVLYSFCSARQMCTDGIHPYPGLVRDSAGNLYGTTTEGGHFSAGTVFKMSSDGKLTTLHSFQNNGTDAYSPSAGLLMDSSGNLYGTSYYGGKYGLGTVYRVTPAGKESIMHSFGATSTDGANPANVVPVMDRLGNLYGTTEFGGSVLNKGTVFEITAGGKESVLYTFGATATDAEYPYAGLTIDAEGNLYGTTGGIGPGAVFRVTHSGTETVVHSFQNTGTGGEAPWAPLVRDAAGNLYGETFGGGLYGFGTVFKINTSGVEIILHAFAYDGTDGVSPYGGLLLDSAGNLYGATEGGGGGNPGCNLYGCGTVFKITP